VLSGFVFVRCGPFATPEEGLLIRPSVVQHRLELPL
jgi:hypothetical protein